MRRVELEGRQNRDVDNVFQEPLTAYAVLAGNSAGITADRPRVIVDVNLILRRDRSLLLGRRCNTEFANGCYSLPAGHLDLGESVIDALVREAREELGILVAGKDVKFVQVMHNSYGVGRFAVFFEVSEWGGRVRNMEPNKCDDLRWFPTTELPTNMVPYIRNAIEHYLLRPEACLTLYGWNASSGP
jgi:8-oxo-dGTP diphosphatase